MANKTKRVPFDIEKAKQGAKVVTKDGDPVRIVSYDRKSLSGDFPICALIDVGEYEMDLFFRKDGTTRDVETYNLYIEEEIKTQRMTNKELANWISLIHGVYRQVLENGCVYDNWSYIAKEENDEVKPGVMIREEYGEWREPIEEI